MSERPGARRRERPVGREGRRRDAPGDDVVYGRNAVREALRGPRRVHRVLVGEASSALGFLVSPGCPVEVVAGDVLSSVAGSDEHQGVVARVDPYVYADAAAFLVAERPLIVALDGITDPQNLGAIARTAECAGATGVVLPEHRSASVTAAVCKASAGAVEHLAIARVRNLADWIERAKGPGLWVYAADLDDAVAYTGADLAGGIVLVIGAEGRGIRPRVRAACDAALALPLAGRIESLNASVAAGVLLYEARRQRNLS